MSKYIRIAIFIDILFLYIGCLGEASGAFIPYVFAFDVPFFFFLMGCHFRLSGEEKISRRTLAESVKKNLLPMWVFTFAVAGLHYFLMHAPKDVMPSLFRNALIGNIRNSLISGASWLLSCLFVMEFLFRLLLLLKDRRVIAVLCAVCYAATLLVFPEAPRVAPSWAYNADSALHYLLFYAAGYLLFPYIGKVFEAEQLQKNKAFIVSFVLSGLFSVAFFFFPAEIYDIFSPADILWEISCFLLIPAVLSWCILCLARCLQQIRFTEKICISQKIRIPKEPGEDYAWLLCNEQVFVVVLSAAANAGWILPVQGVAEAVLRMVVACLVLIPAEKLLARAVLFLLFGTKGYEPSAAKKTCSKGETGRLLGTLLVFLLFIGGMHLRMQIISDDAVNVTETLQRGGLGDNIFYFYMSNGKMLTDGLVATVMYWIPFALWKLLDTMVYGVLLYIIWKLFTDRSVVMFCACGVFLVLFPVAEYLRSAGYIATTTNYVYTMLGVFLAITPWMKMYRKEKIGVAAYLLSFVGLLYAENQDQTAAILIGFFLLTGGYYLVRWIQEHDAADKRMLSQSMRYLLICVLVYIWMFFTPGHLFRMSDDVEMRKYLPQFAEWTLPYKLFRGAATTIANLFFARQSLFVIFVILLIAYIVLKNKKQRWCAIALAVLLLAAAVLDSDWFICYPAYADGMPDLQEIAANPAGIITAAVLLVILVCAVYAVYVADRRLGSVLFVLNVLGFGSRIMMGLSPTLYISSYRTFTAQLFCFILCNVVLTNAILKHYTERKAAERPHKKKTPAGKNGRKKQEVSK